MKKNVEKILFIHPYFGNGGAEKGIRNLSNSLEKEGFIVHLFCLQIHSDVEKRLRSIFFIKSSSNKISNSLFDFFKIIMREKYSIVIPTQTPSISFYVPIIIFANAILKNKNNNKKIKIISFERLSPKIFYESGSFKFIRKLAYYLGLRLSDCLLTNSLEQLSEYKYKFPNKFSFYIPNSSSTAHLKNELTEKQKYHKQNRYKILWLGRFEKIKDPLLAIDTMRYLNEKFYLNIVGNGSMLDQINMRVKSYQLANKINIYSNNKQLKLDEYDLILHTSQFEGLPNTFIESLSRNIPIVTTLFTTGLCELFIPYWIYPCERSALDLAEKIKEALSENDKNIRKSSKIDELISNYYDDKNMFKSFMNAINKL